MICIGFVCRLVSHPSAVLVQVAEFCKGFKALKSMGFRSDVIAGALIVNNNDLQAATDACLAAQ